MLQSFIQNASPLINRHSSHARQICHYRQRNVFKFNNHIASALPDQTPIHSDTTSPLENPASIIQEIPLPPSPTFHAIPINTLLSDIQSHLHQQQLTEECVQETLSRLRKTHRELQKSLYDLAEKAQPILTEDEPPEEAVEAFTTLVQLAGFDILPRFQKLDPPPDALKLGVSLLSLDPSIIMRSRVVRERLSASSAFTYECYPHVFVATRGVSILKRSGLLLPQKVRALERMYFGWIERPFELLMDPLRRLLNRDDDAVDQIVESKYLLASGNEGERVRRVVPAVKLDMSWKSLKSLFNPSVTEEPAHTHLLLLYRRVKATASKDALKRQIQTSMDKAINPTPRVDAKSTPRPFGRAEKATLELFCDVRWGFERHIYPNTYVLPGTKDLLRMDALTFVGLVSACVTYVRDFDSWLVTASLVGCFITYFVRVGLGWRAARMGYRWRIAEEKGEGRFARQGFCLNGLAGLAVSEGVVWSWKGDVPEIWSEYLEGTGIERS